MSRWERRDGVGPIIAGRSGVHAWCVAGGGNRVRADGTVRRAFLRPWALHACAAAQGRQGAAAEMASRGALDDFEGWRDGLDGTKAGDRV